MTKTVEGNYRIQSRGIMHPLKKVGCIPRYGFSKLGNVQVFSGKGKHWPGH